MVMMEWEGLPRKEASRITKDLQIKAILKLLGIVGEQRVGFSD